MIIIESIEQLNSEIQDCEKKHIIVDFFADWCKPCKKIAPVYKTLEGKYDKVHFLKVNIDDVPEAAEKYTILKLPTFMFFNKGNLDSPYERIIGPKEDEITSQLNEFIKNDTLEVDDF